MICGLATMLQACRFGRIGAGHVIVMSSSTAFIGIAIDAIELGGGALFVTLVVVASSALATVAVIVLIALKAGGALRLWAPVIGVAAGTVIGAFFGLYDFGRVADASWLGLRRGRIWGSARRGRGIDRLEIRSKAGLLVAPAGLVTVHVGDC